MPIEYRAEIIKLSTEQRQVEINIKLLVLTKTRERNHWTEKRERIQSTQVPYSSLLWVKSVIHIQHKNMLIYLSHTLLVRKNTTVY